MQENETVFNAITQKLQSVHHTITEHEPVRTSEEAAQVRGTTLDSGAKAMLICNSASMVLAVMSASKKLDWKMMKRTLGTKSLRFANEEEVVKATGCLPGGVPPFGSVFGLQTYLDESLKLQGEYINFNAGLRTKSISMRVQDYIQTENPIESNFTK